MPRCRSCAGASDELGMVAGVIPAVMAPLVGLGGSQFDPLYAEAERLGCPLAVHGGPVTGLGLDMFESLAEARPLEHAMPQMVQIMSMINAGVYDRFPTCGWPIWSAAPAGCRS